MPARLQQFLTEATTQRHPPQQHFGPPPLVGVALTWPGAPGSAIDNPTARSVPARSGLDGDLSSVSSGGR